jgi:hypothetical protein
MGFTAAGVAPLQGTGSVALHKMRLASTPPVTTGSVKAAVMPLPRAQQGQMALARAQGGQWP